MSVAASVDIVNRKIHLLKIGKTNLKAVSMKQNDDLSCWLPNTPCLEIPQISKAVLLHSTSDQCAYTTVLQPNSN